MQSAPFSVQHWVAPPTIIQIKADHDLPQTWPNDMSCYAEETLIQVWRRFLHQTDRHQLPGYLEAHLRVNGLWCDDLSPMVIQETKAWIEEGACMRSVPTGLLDAICAESATHRCQRDINNRGVIPMMGSLRHFPQSDGYIYAVGDFEPMFDAILASGDFEDGVGPCTKYVFLPKVDILDRHVHHSNCLEAFLAASGRSAPFKSWTALLLTGTTSQNTYLNAQAWLDAKDVDPYTHYDTNMDHRVGAFADSALPDPVVLNASWHGSVPWDITMAGTITTAVLEKMSQDLTCMMEGRSLSDYSFDHTSYTTHEGWIDIDNW
ncbi:MAG: hypothetical protein EA401_14445 [Planctomycetota bacterium]|nr:MAG: hypothetical protein EA401_14445 [Planctomycetota bacterium]